VTAQPSPFKQATYLSNRLKNSICPGPILGLQLIRGQGMGAPISLTAAVAALMPSSWKP
jgi:hypothetical protein